MASGVLFALVASALVAAASIAQEAPPEPAGAPQPPPADAVTDTETPPADVPAPPAEDPAPTEPAQEPPVDPAPAQDDPPPVVGIGVETPAAPAPEPAAPAGPTAPGPGTDAGAPAPSAADTAEPAQPGIVKDPSPEPGPEPAASPSGDDAGGDTVSAKRAVPQGVFASWEKADYFTGDRNDCREFGGDSKECAQLLYAEICVAPGEEDRPFGGRYYDPEFCADVLAGNPCTQNPDSDDCRLILNSSCFDPPTADETKCFHIRNALFEPDNPCRAEGPDSQACASFATEQRCQERALADEDCDLYLLFLRGFSAEQEAQCLDTFRDQGAAAAAQTSRACGLYISVVMDACTFIYPPVYGCGPLRFGGADEAEGGFDSPGNGGGDGDDGGDGPIGGPGAGGDGGFKSTIFDPGRDGGLGPVSDEGGDDDGRRRGARALPRSGRDLGTVLLLSLALVACGAGLHRRVRRYELEEAAR